jgi:hypothetical protein
MNKKIYFAGSIRGGRVDAALYQRIIQYINKTDVVLKQKKVRRDRCLVLAHFFQFIVLSIEWFS